MEKQNPHSSTCVRSGDAFRNSRRLLKRRFCVVENETGAHCLEHMSKAARRASSMRVALIRHQDPHQPDAAERICIRHRAVWLEVAKALGPS